MCVANCSVNEELVRGNCVCRQNTILVDGRCTQCPPYSTLIFGNCICNSTNLTTKPGVPCPPPVNCGVNGYWDDVLKCCKCIDSYIWVMGGCKKPQTCPLNSLWIGSGCCCNYGYKQIGAVCQSVKLMPYCP
jgi:hypothetical protein